MTEMAGQRGGWRSNGWRAALWALLAAPLAAALVAMRFDSGVDWSGSDFAVMGVMLGLVGLGLELAVRASGSLAYRAAAAVAVGTAFLLIWVNLAVGFLGSEGNAVNLVFLAVLAVAAGGAIVARARPEGMARALAASAGAQIVAGTIGVVLVPDLWGFTVGTLMFTALWLLSAWLFRQAARG